MPTITIYTFDGVASTGASKPYDPAKNPASGFAADLANRLVAADRDTWAWTPIDYGASQILTTGEPFGFALARGLTDTINKIIATPGKVVLASHSQGTLLSTMIYNEFRYGALRGRRSDLIGITSFGDATRPGGWSTPLYNSRDAGGTGAMTFTLKQTYGQSNTGLVNVPEPFYWSFANLGDLAAAAPSGVQPMLSQIIRRILNSGIESPDKLIFFYGENGVPNAAPTTAPALADLTLWCATNSVRAQATSNYKGQSILDLIIALVGNSTVLSVSGILTLLSQWWPFTNPGNVLGWMRPILPQSSFNPHTRYSGLFPYTGLLNNSKTAVSLAYEYLLSVSKKYLPTAVPPVNSKADRLYQFYTFGKTGDLYAADGRRTTVGLDGCTVDINRSDIDYTQVSIGAEIAKRIDPTKVEWVPVSYSSAAFPLRLPIQNAVDKAVRMILATPPNTKFFLAGNGVGAAVTSELYDEFRTGRLQGRQRQLLGVYQYGNPYRETGAYRANTDPGGHGMAGIPYRIVNTDPSMVWEFVNPGDPVAVEADSIQGQWSAALYDIMYFNVNHPNTLKSQISEALVRPNNADPDLIAFILDTLNNMYGPTGKHNEYLNYFPFSQTKNSIQLAADNINSIVGVSTTSGSATETTEDVITPATRPSLMNTRTYICVPDAHVLDSADLDRTYSAIKKANVDYVRIPVPWKTIQPTRNLLTADRWTISDSFVNRALRANLQPLLVIAPPIPLWTSVATSGDVVAFVTELVKRYKPNGTGITNDMTGRGVLEYQIWDEPNVAESWPTTPSPVQYTNWLKALYPVIKDLQPSAKVIFGGLQSCNTAFPVKSRNPTNIDPATFLSKCYEYGAKAYFDTMAYHPLTLSTRQIPRPLPPNARTIAEADRVRAVMVGAGDSTKSMYWTSMGFDTALVSPTQQRDYLNAMRWFAQSRPWVTGLGVYSYRDSTTAGIL